MKTLSTMNKLKFTLSMLCMTLGLTFQSCNDDDHYSLGDMAIDWATVVSYESGTYYLVSDTWGTLWPAATSLPHYNPKDGQRVIAVFNPLDDDFQGFDHAIKVEGIDEVLTKDVEILTESNDAEYGNDPIYIKGDGLWISGGHLNVAFVQNLPAEQKHRISLVTPATEADADGYLPVELRYNTYGDVTGYAANGYASFNLLPYQETEGVKGIRVKLNLEEKGELTSTIDFE